MSTIVIGDGRIVSDTTISAVRMCELRRTAAVVRDGCRTDFGAVGSRSGMDATTVVRDGCSTDFGAVGSRSGVHALLDVGC